MTPAATAGSFLIPGPAGNIECTLKLPAGAPRLAAVVCHPHPLHGGSMHSKVVYWIAGALAAAGAAALRFQFRGTGLSEGSHDGGRGEADDLRAVLDHLAGAHPGLPIVVAGYSFGAWVGLGAGSRDARVAALAGVGLATTIHSFDTLAGCAKPKLFVQGGADPLGPAAAVEALVASLPPPRRLVVLEGEGHLLEGGRAEIERVIADFAGEVAAPPAYR